MSLRACAMIKYGCTYLSVNVITGVHVSVDQSYDWSICMYIGWSSVWIAHIQLRDDSYQVGAVRHHIELQKIPLNFSLGVGRGDD